MNFNLRQHLRASLLATSAALLFASTPCASAQAVFGQILGTVTDPTGAAIPNATITVTDVAKGTTVTLTSNASGEFTVEHLIPDTYTVKVSAPGFKAFEQKQLTVDADEAPKVTAVLTIGASDQVVEVNADDVPQLKTDKVDVATTFSASQIEELPIPDHNFANLQLLLPGAVQLGWAHAASENPQGSKQIQIDGQAFGGVNYTLDGTDNQDAILGIIVINPNSESMSEAKIATQNFDAEFGKAVASVQTVQTKSGTNQFHGSLFDNRESNANLARDPFSGFNQTTGKDIPYPSGLKNQFGGSVGGPIIKDRVFFFADYQGVRQKVGSTETASVPSLLALDSCTGTTPASNGQPGCDFSEYINPANVGTNNFTIYNNNQTSGTATLGAQFPGNIIPLGLVSPQAQNLFKLLLANKITPNHNTGVTGNDNGLYNNYSGSGAGSFNSNQWDVRGDATITEKIHAFGRFSRFTDTLSGASPLRSRGWARPWHRRIWRRFARSERLSRSGNRHCDQLQACDGRSSGILPVRHHHAQERSRQHQPSIPWRKRGNVCAPGTCRLWHSGYQHRRPQRHQRRRSEQSTERWRPVRHRPEHEPLQLPVEGERGSVPGRQQLDQDDRQPCRQIWRGPAVCPEPSCSLRRRPHWRKQLQ